MSLQSRLTTLVQAVGADIKYLLTKQGNLGALTTAAKSDLVAAINEVAASGGGGGETVVVNDGVSIPSSVAGAVVIYAALSNSGVSAVPEMTSNTLPSGVASASTTWSGVAPWHAFSTTGWGGWLSDGSSLPQWLAYQFPTAKTIYGYTIAPWDVDNFPYRCPKDFKLQGSSDGTSWTDLDSRTNITSWAVATPKMFEVTSPGSYTYYRLYVTANCGDAYTGLRHLDLNEGALRLWAVNPDGTRAVLS
ncbi:MAG: hypothetical protein RIR09_2559 [Pseudomonadota bacterium]|jgi:hypothetical protein